MADHPSGFAAAAGAAAAAAAAPLNAVQTQAPAAALLPVPSSTPSTRGSLASPYCDLTCAVGYLGGWAGAARQLCSWDDEA